MTTDNTFIPLDKNEIYSVIRPENLAFISQFQIFDTINSTNTYLLNQLNDKKLSGRICLAEEQTQGRGRLDRRWYSPKAGNIYCSLLWNFKHQDVSALSLSIGIILIKAITRYSNNRNIKLKWPNDVVFEGKKLGGILLEKRGPYVVIGIGLNIFLSEKMDALLIPTSIDLTSITQHQIKRNVLIGFIIDELIFHLRQYNNKLLLGEWQKYDALFGQNIKMQVATQTYYGVMQGVNEHGELLLLQNDGAIKSFCYGQASVRFLDN